MLSDRAKVLVVDDDESTLEAISRALGLQGYNVVTTHDAAAALTIMQRDASVTVLVVDIVLTGPMDARELVEKARHLRSELKVIYTTAYSELLVSDREAPDHAPLVRIQWQNDHLLAALEIEPVDGSARELTTVVARPAIGEETRGSPQPLNGKRNVVSIARAAEVIGAAWRVAEARPFRARLGGAHTPSEAHRRVCKSILGRVRGEWLSTARAHNRSSVSTPP